MDRSCVDDDREIADIARAYGAEIRSSGPAALAADDTPDLPVFRHAWSGSTSTRLGRRVWCPQTNLAAAADWRHRSGRSNSSRSKIRSRFRSWRLPAVSESLQDVAHRWSGSCPLRATEMNEPTTSLIRRCRRCIGRTGYRCGPSAAIRELGSRRATTSRLWCSTRQLDRHRTPEALRYADFYSVLAWMALPCRDASTKA